MSYLVFARKYRPQTFSQILGQEPIVKTLTNAIKQGRVGQAYLFAGPRGTGKTSTARIFAKGLNCLKGPTPSPCLKCDRCVEIAAGGSLDVLEIDGASNRGIDEIRALRELAKFSPAAGTYKVYLIDEVHQITPDGFNALLKTLEEPPPHLLFILATTAPHKVPATILSRCQRYDFRRLPFQVIAEKIKAVAREESIEISKEAVAGIARAAQGSLRDAESILDQVTAFTGGKIGEKDLRVLLGELDEEIFCRAVEAIRAQEPVKLLALVAEASNAGTDLQQWGMGFLSFMRNLLVAKAGAGSLAFEEMGQESLKRLGSMAEGFSIEELTAIIQELTLALELMRRVEEPRIPLEVALVRMGSGGSLASVSELLERVEQLGEAMKKGAGGGGLGVGQNPVSPAPATAPIGRPSDLPTGPSTRQRVNACLPDRQVQTREPSSGLGSALAVWPEFMNAMHQRKASIAGYLAGGRPIEVEGGDPPCVVVGFPRGFEFHCDALNRLETKQLVAELLGGLMGQPVRCSFRVVADLAVRQEASPGAEQPAGPGQEGAEPIPDPPPPGGRPSREELVVRSVLELFEGRVLPGES